MSQDLTSLRTVIGADGAFLFHTDGTLHGRDLPNLYSNELLVSLQNPILLAFRTADQYLGTFDDLLLRFRERSLYIRRLEELILCVIALPSCNIDGLRMGSNLLISQAKKIAASAPAPTPFSVAPAAANSGGFFAPPASKPRPIPAAASPQRPAPPSRPGPPPKSKGIWG
jgi:predicted regulator of Ras-like GTPase activity (Roadblock/LC7/MglB family)